MKIRVRITIKNKYAQIFGFIYVVLAIGFKMIEWIFQSLGTAFPERLITAYHCFLVVGFSILIFWGVIEKITDREKTQESKSTLKTIINGLFYIYMTIVLISSVFLVFNSDNNSKAHIQVPSKPAMNSTVQDFEHDKEKAYKAIYNEYFKTGGYTYTVDYDAKGNSRIVLIDNSSMIEYITYENISQEGNAMKFKHCRAAKDSFGSWSVMNAEYLDTYIYDFSTRKATKE